MFHLNSPIGDVIGNLILISTVDSLLPLRADGNDCEGTELLIYYIIPRDCWGLQYII